jgi:chemotaxis protein MotB
MSKLMTRFLLGLMTVSIAAGCSGQKLQTLKDAICCDGGYEYRTRDRIAAEKEAQARIAAQERDRQRLNDELAAARKDAEALAAKSRSLEDQLADRGRELAASRAKTDDLQGDLNRANAKSANLERQLADSLSVLASSQSQVSALQAGAGDQEKLAAELAAAHVAVAALEARANDNDKLAGELAQAKTRNSELESQLAALTAAALDKDKLAAELGQTKTRNSELESQVAALAAAVADKDRLSAEVAAAQRRTAELEQQIADRERQMAGLRGDLSAEMAKLKEAERGVIRALRPQIEKGTIMVDLNNERLLINLASGYLFGSGEDQLKPAGADALRQVGAILKDFPEYKVSVDGHTDNRPIRSELKRKYPSNKELSEARAANAALALGDGGLSAVTTHGFADSQPVMPNSTDAGRAKNRRVEVRVTK